MTSEETKTPASSTSVGGAVVVGGRARRAGHLALVGLAVAGLLALKAPLCPFAFVAKRPCPGCGLTRATFELVRGDFAHAASLHPLVFVAVPLFGAAAVLGASRYYLAGTFALPRPFARIFGPAVVLLMVAMIALWIARFNGALGGPIPV